MEDVFCMKDPFSIGGGGDAGENVSVLVQWIPLEICVAVEFARFGRGSCLPSVVERSTYKVTCLSHTGKHRTLGLFQLGLSFHES